MSVSKWRYTEACDGAPCPGDCDECGKNEELKSIRLIDADEVIEAIMTKIGSVDTEADKEHAKEIINNIPTVDTDLSGYSDKLWRAAYERGKAEGRNKGEWIYHTEPLACNPYGHYTCSLCEEISWDESNYCPNCGANMRRKESEVDE